MQRALAILALLFLVSCTSTGTAPVIPLNDTISIDQIDISDCSQLAIALDKYILEHSDGWKTIWHTLPTPHHTVSFWRQDEHQMNLFIGVNWISDGNYIRSLTAKERMELYRILNLE